MRAKCGGCTALLSMKKIARSDNASTATFMILGAVVLVFNATVSWLPPIVVDILKNALETAAKSNFSIFKMICWLSSSGPLHMEITFLIESGGERCVVDDMHRLGTA
eukprot:2982192-Rhodomonas_salina.3